MSASTEVPEDTVAIAFLRQLVSAQTQGESAVQELIAERLEQAGCEIQRHEYDPAEVPVIGEFAADTSRATERRTAVVGTLVGDPEKRSLLMFAHPDAEPLQQDHGWKYDPFAGTVDQGRMYGWGIADDLAGCAAAVLAIEKAAQSGDSLGSVSFASTPSKRYARGVAALLHHDLDADASLYLHPAESGVGMQEIKALASGQLEFRITVHGQLPDTTEPGHTAFSHLAVNPIDKAMIIIAALQSLAKERGERVHHPRLDAAVKRSTNLQVSTIRCGEMRSFSRLHEDCQLGGAISFPPGETFASVQAEFEAALQACVEKDAWLADHPPTLEWLTGVTGAEVEETHPLYQVTSQAVRRVTELEPWVNAMHTSSDIRNPPVEKGIPCVGLGCLCGDLTQNDKHNEWVDVDDYLRMVDVTTAVAIDWCR